MVEHELSMDELAAQEAIELPEREMMHRGGNGGLTVVAPTLNIATVTQTAVAIAVGGAGGDDTNAFAANFAAVAQQGAGSEFNAGGPGPLGGE